MHNSMAPYSDGISNFVRVRKPPGGDTSDIFNLGTSKSKSNQDEKKTLGFEKTMVGEKIKAYKSDDCRKNSPKISEFDKENVTNTDITGDVFAENKLDVCEFEFKPDESLDEGVLKISIEDEEEETKLQNFVCHNPITGEVTKVGALGERPKLKDCSNKMRRAGIYSENAVDTGVSRPSIRVRQPPGGVSSNIFQW